MRAAIPWTDGGLPTCEPPGCADLSLDSSVVLDCGGASYSHTCTVSCASGYVASDMDDAVFQCLAPPGIPDETLPRCVYWLGIRPLGGYRAQMRRCVGLDDNCGAEGAQGVAETDPCVWNDSIL